MPARSYSVTIAAETEADLDRIEAGRLDDIMHTSGYSLEYLERRD